MPSRPPTSAALQAHTPHSYVHGPGAPVGTRRRSRGEEGNRGGRQASRADGEGRGMAQGAAGTRGRRRRGRRGAEGECLYAGSGQTPRRVLRPPSSILCLLAAANSSSDRVARLCKGRQSRTKETIHPDRSNNRPGCHLVGAPSLSGPPPSLWCPASRSSSRSSRTMRSTCRTRPEPGVPPNVCRFASVWECVCV